MAREPDPDVLRAKWVELEREEALRRAEAQQRLVTLEEEQQGLKQTLTQVQQSLGQVLPTPRNGHQPEQGDGGLGVIERLDRFPAELPPTLETGNKPSEPDANARALSEEVSRREAAERRVAELEQERCRLERELVTRDLRIREELSGQRVRKECVQGEAACAEPTQKQKRPPAHAEQITTRPKRKYYEVHFTYFDSGKNVRVAAKETVQADSWERAYDRIRGRYKDIMIAHTRQYYE